MVGISIKALVGIFTDRVYESTVIYTTDTVQHAESWKNVYWTILWYYYVVSELWSLSKHISDSI